MSNFGIYSKHVVNEAERQRESRKIETHDVNSEIQACYKYDRRLSVYFLKLKE